MPGNDWRYRANNEAARSNRGARDHYGAAVRNPEMAIWSCRGNSEAKDEPGTPPGRASEPMTRRPVRCPAATGYQAPQEFAGRPVPARVPWVSPGLARLRW